MKIKNFAVALVAFSAISSTAFSMDHPDVRAVGSNPAKLRQVANEKARALDLAAPAAHHAIGTHMPEALDELLQTVGGDIQDYVDYAIVRAVARVNAELTRLLPAGAGAPLLDGAVTRQDNGGPTLPNARTVVFGPNGGPALDIAAPADVNRGSLLAGLTLALNDQNTKAEFELRNAAQGNIVDIGNNPSASRLMNAIQAVNAVLGEKAAAYITGLLGADGNVTVAGHAGIPVTTGGAAVLGGAAITRDRLAAHFRSIVETY